MITQEKTEAGLSWGAFSVKFDYDYSPINRNLLSTRAGNIIFKKIESRRGHYIDLISSISTYKNKFRKISFEEQDVINPFWDQTWFPAFDGMLLYGLLSIHKPEHYIEIGSGNSTKFARRAIKDNNLPTKIISIDPNPRAEITDICDTNIRSKIQDIPNEELLSLIRPGDIFFIDNSHRSFQGSDVTVCFSEIVPALSPGVIYGFHDIFIPFDYPKWFEDYYYNEQYLLQTYLLGGAAGDEIIFPTWYVSTMRELAAPFYDVLNIPELANTGKGGSSFWMKKG
jgi:hypothetical protein